jgi:hypothetical protein
MYLCGVLCYAFDISSVDVSVSEFMIARRYQIYGNTILFGLKQQDSMQWLNCT